MILSKTRFASLLLFISLALVACDASFTAASWPGISVDEENNRIYVAYNQHVYALSSENGAENWRFPTEADNGITFFAKPELANDGQLIVGAYDNDLYSLDASGNGRLNWQFSEAGDRYVGPALAVDSTIYVPNSDNNLYSLSSNGQLNWTFASNESLWAAPVSDGNNLYISSLDHHLYSIDIDRGTTRWEIDLGGGIAGSPAISEDGTLFVGTFASEIVALNSSNGVIQWRRQTDAWIWGSPAYSEGIVYAGDIEGNVYAFDALSGDSVWRVSANGTIAGTPLIANEHIYIGTEAGQIMSIGTDGVIQWTQSLEGQAYGSLALAGELIVVGLVESDSVVVALDENGNRVWSFNP